MTKRKRKPDARSMRSLLDGIEAFLAVCHEDDIDFIYAVLREETPHEMYALLPYLRAVRDGLKKDLKPK